TEWTAGLRRARSWCPHGAAASSPMLSPTGSTFHASLNPRRGGVMALDTLPALITLLIALSIATERAVEITKSLIPWLDASHTVPALEARRRAAVHTPAAGFGIAPAPLRR